MVKTKEKACKICKAIYEVEDKCPKCGAKESIEGFKGRVYIKDPAKSEIAGKLSIHEKGDFAIKTR